MCGNCGCEHHEDSVMSHDEKHAMGIAHSHEHLSRGVKMDVERDVLETNNRLAERNRGFLEAKNIFCLNMVSSPGSGKTTLLENMISRMKNKIDISVIEGDQQTSNDSDRISALGIDNVQINTQSGCHLDAAMVHQAVKQLNPHDHSLLVIENVGNLVCPALFDLGESERVVVISVTEGDDKPLKYPYMFASADICLINKIDLLPYLDCKIEILRENLYQVNPSITVFEVSATRGSGMDEWCLYVEKKIKTA